MLSSPIYSSDSRDLFVDGVKPFISTVGGKYLPTSALKFTPIEETHGKLIPLLKLVESKPDDVVKDIIFDSIIFEKIGKTGQTVVEQLVPEKNLKLLHENIIESVEASSHSTEACVRLRRLYQFTSERSLANFIIEMRITPDNGLLELRVSSGSLLSSEQYNALGTTLIVSHEPKTDEKPISEEEMRRIATEINKHRAAPATLPEPSEQGSDILRGWQEREAARRQVPFAPEIDRYPVGPHQPPFRPPFYPHDFPFGRYPTGPGNPFSDPDYRWRPDSRFTLCGGTAIPVDNRLFEQNGTGSPPATAGYLTIANAVNRLKS